MQYWINHNGVQSGPVSPEQMKEMGLTSRAYVWHEGLADWVKITQLPELQGLYAMTDELSEPQPDNAASATDEPIVGQPYQPSQQQPSGYASQQYTPAQQRYEPAAQSPAPAEPCPPTNLVWAIITTVLCCLPAGIVAIVYALKVTNKYQQGDIEGAKRASETGAWWCIASIILGILSMPFASMMSMLSTSALQ